MNNRAAVRWPRLVATSEPVFAAILDLKTCIDVRDQHSIYRRAETHLQQMRAATVSDTTDPDAITLAHFALAAFIDEILMGSDWRYRAHWPLLQYRRFQTHRAGDGFFQNLASIRDDPFDPAIWRDSARADLLEVYYLCLLLGFHGKWGVLLGQEAYQQQIAQLHEDIRAKPVGPLSPNLSPPDLHDVVRVRGGWPWWVWLSITLVIMLTVFGLTMLAI